MLGLVGSADNCVEHVPENGVKHSSDVEVKLWLGEIELDRSLLLVCEGGFCDSSEQPIQKAVEAQSMVGQTM